MSFERFSKLLLVVLALALWAGTANAQPAVGTPLVSLTYVAGGGGANVTTTTSTTSATAPAAAGDTFTVAVSNYLPNGGPTGWLSAAETGSFGIGDTVTYTLITTSALTWPAGTYTATVTITDTTDANATATTTVTLMVTSPLSATAPGSTVLNWVKGGIAGQASATTFVTISNADTTETDAYTVVPANCPAWLTATAAPSQTVAHGTATVLTFAINSTGFNTAAPSPASYPNCTETLEYNGAAFSAAPTAVVSLSVNYVTQPLLASAASVPLSYNKGTTNGTLSATVVISQAKNTPATMLYLDTTTLPPWLTTTSGFIAPTYSASLGLNASVSVVFGLVTTVAAGLPTGNYNTQVGFYATGDMATEVMVTVYLQISNAAPTLTTNPSTETFKPITPGSSAPATPPSVTVFSSDEPAPFTATCTVVLSPATYVATTGDLVGCSLNGQSGLASATGNVVNGTAFTWGYTMTATLDPAYFAQTIGNTVTVTIHFTNTSSTAPANVLYQYTIQPGNPGITSVSPNSISAKYPTTQSLVVLVTGTNFVSQNAIVPNGSVEATQVWLGAAPGTKLDNSTNTALGTYVVLNATQILVTIPGNSTAIPVVTTGHTGVITIGVANQVTTPPTAAYVAANVNVTYAPVIYAITDTASYVQPSLGTPPSFSPFELISIFGDNFGLTNGASAIATFDSNGKIVSPTQIIAASGSGSSAIKAETLAVNFVNGSHSYSAPVLFANQNQINAIVPSQVTPGTNYTVVVALAGGTSATSDNSVTVATQANNPGIFTLASDGTGAGAIVNQDGSINGAGHTAAAGSIITLYASGLGAPTSTGTDVTGNTASFPSTCVSTAAWFANVTTKITGANAYTPPSPAWSSIDGAVVTFGPHAIIAGNYQPCMATDTITVTLSTLAGGAVTPITGANIAYAGWVSGSVAGLYQVNATLPGTLTGLTGKINLTLTINGVASPPVTMLVP